MRYEKVGEGPLLVLLPGLGCDGRLWGSVLDHFTVPFTAVVPEIWTANSMGEAADGVRDILDELSTPQAFVAGLSMGGYLTFELLARHGDRVRAAALCDTTAFPDGDERRETRTQTIRLIEAGKFDQVLNPFIETVIWQDGPRAEAASELMRRMAQVVGPEDFARSMASIRDRGDYLSVLRGTDVPLLFLAGTHDELSPVELAADMAKAARDGTGVEIPDAGHMSALENPGAVAEALEDFFRRFLQVG